MHRRSVDFPEPERPSRATISPSRTFMSMPSSTASSPSRVAKVLRRPRTSISLMAEVVVAVDMVTESKRIAGFGQPIEPAPEEAVDRDDIDAHRGEPRQDLVKVAGLAPPLDTLTPPPSSRVRRLALIGLQVQVLTAAAFLMAKVIELGVRG